MPLCMDTTECAPKPPGKALRKAGFELRREVDLGHHHQRLRSGVALQQGLHGVQVDLGLAAAGGAEQQEGAGLGGDLREGGALLCAQGRRRGGGGRLRSRLRRLGVALEAPLQLFVVDLAQRRRQRGQRHFTGGSLVVAGGKFQQGAPACAQWGNAFQHPGNVAQLVGLRCVGGRVGGVPHHAQRFARAQRHAHQRARGQRLAVAVAQHRAQLGMGGGVNQNVQAGGRHGGQTAGPVRNAAVPEYA